MRTDTVDSKQHPQHQYVLHMTLCAIQTFLNINYFIIINIKRRDCLLLLLILTLYWQLNIQ